MKKRSLYIKGREDLILKVLDYVRPLVGKGDIHLVCLDEELQGVLG